VLAPDLIIGGKVFDSLTVQKALQLAKACGV
ncbi:uncharacterized protein METZ01_LOCUS317656, partial [marine metagenome]